MVKTIRVSNQLKYRLDLIRAQISRNGDGSITFNDLLNIILEVYEEAMKDE